MKTKTVVKIAGFICTLPILAIFTNVVVSTETQPLIQYYVTREFNDDPKLTNLNNSPSYVFRLDNHPDDPLRHDECKNHYSPEGNHLMNNRFYNVQHYGARGRRSSISAQTAQLLNDKSRTGVGPERICLTCASGIGDQAIGKLYERLDWPQRTVIYCGGKPLDANGNVIPKEELDTRVAVNSRRFDFFPGFNAGDEWDWIGIQTALLMAHLDGGGTVFIPDTGTDYFINRDIFVGSNTRLVWETNPALATHSRVVLTRPSMVGSVISTGNVYGSRGYGAPFLGLPDGPEKWRGLYAANSDNFKCKIRIHSPRVVAMAGENGLSFGKGTYGVQIYGGKIENAQWGTNDLCINHGFLPQGGRGLQFESGVQQVSVKDTQFDNNYIGISVSAGLYASRVEGQRLEPYLNASDKVKITGVVMDRTELPFSFAHNQGLKLLALGTVRDEILKRSPQSIEVRDFEVNRSGVLKTLPPTPYPDQNPALQSGVINLQGATNVNIGVLNNAWNVIRHNGNYVHSPGLAPGQAAAIVRGNGSDIFIEKIHAAGNYESIVDHHFANGRIGSNPQVARFRLDTVKQIGNVKNVLRLPSAVSSGAYIKRVKSSSYSKLYLSADEAPMKYGEYESTYLPNDLATDAPVQFSVD